MTNDLIARLRAVDHMSVEDCFLQSYLFAYAADVLEGALAESWRPIEDAPHGVEVLLATPPFECMGDQAKWEFRVGRASWGERIGGFSNRSMDAHATHWMPLPPAPISHEKEN